MSRAVSGAAVHAGARDTLITIQQLVEATADSNFPTETWSLLTKTWAAREYVTLDEETTLAQLSARAVVRWEIAYSQSMDPDRIDVAKQRRVIYLGRTFDVLSAELLSREQGRSIVMTTLAKVG